eukprot:COSAG06_NODE_51570_length_311_cov_0.735849_1_plen_32_part_10
MIDSCDALPLAFALSLQLVQEQKVAVRRAIED